MWGKEDVSSLYPARPAKPNRVGEVWLTGDENRIANGPWTGTSLAELARLCGPALLGSDVYRNHTADPLAFPLLVKFLFTSDKLSVQVHPSDFYARQHEASPGKTEMWYVVAAEPGARLAVGFRKDAPGVTTGDRASLRAAVESGEVENLLDWVAVQPGDTFFVPSGTVHAIGAGLVLCEIQQNSDLTYRLYDYNRPGTDGKPRSLHIEKALDVLQFSTPAGRTHPLELEREPIQKLCLAACPYFVTEKWSFRHKVASERKAIPEIWIGLEGEAEFQTGGQPIRCRKGEVVVLPAAQDRFTVHPLQPCNFLRTFSPDLDDYRATSLRARDFTETALSRVYFPMAGLSPEEKS
ncbi:MAG: class I mannose-6-phosphate isomerase [Acidobacteria bacterium]|nr:class I mannose-6-phosphate isomerase [Acidobacteriota bacterium]